MTGRPRGSLPRKAKPVRPDPNAATRTLAEAIDAYALRHRGRRTAHAGTTARMQALVRLRAWHGRRLLAGADWTALVADIRHRLEPVLSPMVVDALRFVLAAAYQRGWCDQVDEEIFDEPDSVIEINAATRKALTKARVDRALARHKRQLLERQIADLRARERGAAETIARLWTKVPAEQRSHFNDDLQGLDDDAVLAAVAQ